MTTKLADVLTPEPLEIPLLRGKTAKVGPLTLEVLCWIEENHGSFEEFQEKYLKVNKPNITAVTDLVYQLIENKDEIGTVKDFRALCPADSIALLGTAVGKALKASMPSEAAGAKSAGTKSAKK